MTTCPPHAAPPHADLQPSAWVRRWSPLLRDGASVLDVACGHGRHMRWFAERGHAVTGVDRDPRAVYWRQVRNGMWIRVALLAHIFDVTGNIRDFSG